MLLRNDATHDEIARNKQIDCFAGDKFRKSLWKNMLSSIMKPSKSYL